MDGISQAKTHRPQKWATVRLIYLLLHTRRLFEQVGSRKGQS